MKWDAKQYGENGGGIEIWTRKGRKGVERRKVGRGRGGRRKE